MQRTKVAAGQAVNRLGVIGNHEWWHCLTCGDVWQTTRGDSGGATSHAAAETRRHLATHAQPQHSGREVWHRPAALRPMSEKHR